MNMKIQSIIDSIKPNFLIIALIGALFVSGLAEHIPAEALSGIAMAYVGALAGSLLLLIAPAPNPMIPESTALRILDLLEPGEGASQKGAHVNTNAVICLILAGSAGLIIYLAQSTDLSDTVIYNVSALWVGIVGSVIGKLADPDATSEQVPQSTVFRLLDILERRQTSPDS